MYITTVTPLYNEHSWEIHISLIRRGSLLLNKLD